MPEDDFIIDISSKKRIKKKIKHEKKKYRHHFKPFKHIEREISKEFEIRKLVQKLKFSGIEKTSDIFKSGLVRKLDEEISKVICILRLFKVGGIKIITTRMHTSSTFPLILGGEKTSFDKIEIEFLNDLI